MGILDNPTPAGRYKHRVTLHQRTIASRAANGENVTADAVTGQRWGFVEPLSGMKLVNAQETYEDVTHRVTLRYDATILQTSAIEYPPGTILEVMGIVDPEASHVELHLMCRSQE